MASEPKLPFNNAFIETVMENTLEHIKKREGWTGTLECDFNHDKDQFDFMWEVYDMKGTQTGGAYITMEEFHRWDNEIGMYQILDKLSWVLYERIKDVIFADDLPFAKFLEATK